MFRVAMLEIKEFTAHEASAHEDVPALPPEARLEIQLQECNGKEAAVYEVMVNEDISGYCAP